MFGVFALMGALVGLAAMLNAVRFDAVRAMRDRPRAQAIAAVVVGGTAISGGRGTVLGTLIGVLLLGTIGTALTFVGISRSGTRRSRGSSSSLRSWPMPRWRDSNDMEASSVAHAVAR